MPEEFHRPVRRPSDAFDKIVGSADPLAASRLAHTTASALLNRVRSDVDEKSADRLIAFTDEHGIDEIAELWSTAPARSLPGALWRLHLVQLAIHSNPESAAFLYERGRVELPSADVVIAGAPVPAGSNEVVALIDTILRGAFRGDFAVALERAAAFCRVQASGSTHVADDYQNTEPARSTRLTKRALRLSEYANDLSASAALWRMDALA